MATARETAFVYATDSEEGQHLSALAEKYHLAVQLRMGGIEAAVEEAASWMIAPHYLILDLTGVDSPSDMLQQISQRGPAGETDVICFGNRDEVELYRDLRRMGVVEYMTRPLSPEDVDEVLRNLIQNRRDESKSIDPERLITVTGARGGAGASTIAGGIAHLIATTHERRTLLLDLDFEGGTQYINFNVEPTSGLLDMVEMPHRIDAVFLERTLEVAGQRLSILSADRAAMDRDFKPEGIDSLIQQAGQGIDSIVVDLPRLNETGYHTLFSAGTVVIATPPTLIGLRDTGHLVEAVEKNGSARRIIVAINDVGMFRAGTLRGADFAKNLGREVIEIPFDGRGVPQGVVQGIPVTEASVHVRKALMKIAAALPSSPGAFQPSVMDRLLGRQAPANLGRARSSGKKAGKG